MAGEKDINLNSIPDNPEETLQEIIDKKLEKELGTKKTGTKKEGEGSTSFETQKSTKEVGNNLNLKPDLEIKKPTSPTQNTTSPISPQIPKENIKTDLQKAIDADIVGEVKTNVSEETKKSSIRTYAGDISSLISKGLSVTEVAVKEQEKKEKGPQPTPKEAKTNGLLIILAVLFVISGIAAGVYSLLFVNRGDDYVGISEIPSIIFANDDSELSLSEDADRISILKAVNNKREAVQNTLGAVTNIYMTITTIVNIETGEEETRIIGAREFLDKINISTRASFRRSLGNNFMIGVHSFDGNQAFLLFEIDDFENALPGILDWEDLILDDLWPMFYSIKPEVGLEEKINPEASSTTPRKFFKAGFEDIILKNKDARVLEDKNDETALIYSFPDKNHLIITTDRTTLIEVFDRLNTSRVSDK